MESTLRIARLAWLLPLFGANALIGDESKRPHAKWLIRDREQVVRFRYQGPAPDLSRPVSLPVHFENDLVFAAPQAIDGRAFKFLVQTGNLVFRIFADSAPNHYVVEYSPLQGLPLQLFEDKALIVWDRRKTDPKESEVHGTIGTDWFSARTWTIDYLNQKWLWRTNGSLPDHDPNQRLNLGFDWTGETEKESKTAFPSISIRVDNMEYNMLMDTGALSYLTADAIAVAGGIPGPRAASFVSAMLFGEWQSKHPDWPVIEKAETDFDEPMIKVPEVEVVGRKLGPVWFSRRPDNDFRYGVHRFLGKPSEGTVGGNILKHFVVTLDYTSGIGLLQIP